MPTWLSTNEANPTFAFENKPGNVFIPTFEKWKVQAHQNGTNPCFLSKNLIEKKNLFTLDHSLQNVQTNICIFHTKSIDFLMWKMCINISYRSLTELVGVLNTNL